MKDKELLQSRDITRGVYKLNLYQKRFLMLGICNCNQDGVATINTEEFAKIYRLDVRDCNRVLKKQRDNILASSVAFDYANGSWSAVNWLQSIEYDGKNNYQIVFSEPVKGHVTSLSKNLTIVDLIELGKLKSVFSMRLFEFASQYSGKGGFFLTVIDLIERFKLAKCYRANTSLINLKIIQPACDDITEKTKLFITCKTVKKGNKIERFEFMVYDKNIV